MAREQGDISIVLIDVLERLMPAVRELGGRLVWDAGHSAVAPTGAKSKALPTARTAAFWWGETARCLAERDVAATAYAAYRLGAASAALEAKLPRVGGGRASAKKRDRSVEIVALVDRVHRELIDECPSRKVPREEAFKKVAAMITHPLKKNKDEVPYAWEAVRNLYYKHAKKSNAKKAV